MGYDPCTQVCSFPRYGGWLYRLSPWIGFDIWHVDPERRTDGQRTDDSCGWFDRRPGPYADAIKWVLDKSTMHEIERAISTRADVAGPYGYTFPRMPLSECLAVVTMIADELELRRWWNCQNSKPGAASSWWRRNFTRKRDVSALARSLALNPLDNISTCDDAEEMVRLIAAALHRRYRPWWKHPRWHVHHWRINFMLTRNLRRMLIERCGTCGKRLGWGYSPTESAGALHHGECLGIHAKASEIRLAP